MYCLVPFKFNVLGQQFSNFSCNLAENLAEFSQIRAHYEQPENSLAIGRGRHLLDHFDFPLVWF